MMPTIKDVAAAANVSSTTVSRFLNGDPTLNIPEDTRDRIVRATQEVGYQFRKNKEFRNKDIRKIGILGYKNEQLELNDPYFLSIRVGVEQELRALGYGGVVTFQWSDYVTNYSALSSLDGLIVISDNPTAADYFRDHGEKTVFIDSSPDPNVFNSVIVDYATSTRQALDHLLGLGYQRIGHIGAVNQFKTPDPRLAVFRAHLGIRGLLDESQIHIAETWSSNDGYAVAQRLVKEGHLAQAYFMASDPLAIGAIRAFVEAGLSVPEDIAVVSFDDIEVAAFMTPPLTTVHVPTEAMGRIAVDILVSGIGGHGVPVQVVIPAQLRVRESCGQHLAGNH